MNSSLHKIHIIAIGGVVMSSLAIALKKMGLTVSGSDDKIYDPVASFLRSHDLFPSKIGWDESSLDATLDAVIIGMHAKANNPELIKAQELGLKIFSYPEFIRAQSDNKQRVVIAGSHGKTTITGMIIHVLNYWKKSFDYLIGAKINGIEETIKLSDAPLIIIEGDEYLTSPLDSEPKFLKYNHHIALISGIAWDHINVYPTEEKYLEQFDRLADATPKAGTLIYCEEDSYAKKIGTTEGGDIKNIPYKTPKFDVKNGSYFINKSLKLKIFGKHNIQNLEGARQVLDNIGITSDQFYEAITSFEGAYKRNNLLLENDSMSVYSDFAHAPSKLKASSTALNDLHPKRKLTACYELHTFSSLNKDFLSHYAGTYNAPDQAIIYYDKNLIKEKNYTEITPEDIKTAFKRKDISVFTEASEVESFLLDKTWENEDLIFMSSGNFGGLDLNSIAEKLVN